MLYIAKRGDTVPTIASKFNCLLPDVYALNQLTDRSSLNEGQTLLLASPQKSSTKKNTYIVRYGDTLQGIAERHFCNANKWRSIAQINHIDKEDLIFVGQELILPEGPITPPFVKEQKPSNSNNQARYFPAQVHIFIIADEFLPSSKVVRKVIFPKDIQGKPELVRQIIKPEKYGIRPINPSSPVSMGRHVLGMTDSRFISASARPFGSPRFDGKPYWINTKRLYSSGATIHDADAISKDLDRIAQKTKDPKFRQYIEDIRYKSLKIDKEVLIEGHIPPGAIKGSVAKGLTHGLQVVSVVGIVMSSYDLSLAASQSFSEGSVKPLATESMRQAGGWGGAYLGAQLGMSVGTLVGIETGPGALLFGAAGGLICGIAGFLGADWITHYISENPQ